MTKEKRTERPNLAVKKGCLADRLANAMGKESILAFSKRANVSEGMIRNLLNGGMPRLDSLIAIAKALGVRLAWLAEGEEPMTPGAASESAQARDTMLADFGGDSGAQAAREAVTADYGKKLRAAREVVNSVVAGRPLPQIYQDLLHHFSFVYEQPEGDDFLEQLADTLCDLTARLDGKEEESNDN